MQNSRFAVAIHTLVLLAVKAGKPTSSEYIAGSVGTNPVLIRRLMGAHTFVYRATGGAIGHTLPGLPTMLLLDHVGAKSGIKRTAPLLYVKDGAKQNLIVRGARALDPVEGVDAQIDVKVDDGVIAELGSNLAPNGHKVIDNAHVSDVPASGPVGLQHHGNWNGTRWTGPPSLIQFRNVYIKEL